MPDELFDLSRLTDCERRVWDEFFTGPPQEGETPAFLLSSFGYICSLECTGWPDVVTEKLRELP